MEELCPMIQELLAGGSTVQLTVTGISMRPMLLHRRDQVELAKAPSKLKRCDIPLYQRQNGSYVLHRIVKVEKDGTYALYDLDGSKKSDDKTSPIVDYHGDYLKTYKDNSYFVHKFNGSVHDQSSHTYIELYDEYYVTVDNKDINIT